MEIAESNGAQVPPQTHAALDRFRRIHTPLFGNGWSLIFLFGAVLSVRRRDGALYGALTAFLGLVSVLAIVDGVDAQVWSIGTTSPLAYNVLTTGAIGPAVLAWSFLVAWFVIRWKLDRRREGESLGSIDGDRESPRRRHPARAGYGAALAGAAVGAVILGGLLFLGSLPFAEDCTPSYPHGQGECWLINFWFLGMRALLGAYAGAVLGCWLGLRLARRPLSIPTAVLSVVTLAVLGYVAFGMTVAVSLPLGLVLFPAALMVGVWAARTLSMRIFPHQTKKSSPTGARS